jgi:hypothetical protein
MRKLLIGFGLGLIVAWIIETRRKREEEQRYIEMLADYRKQRDRDGMLDKWLDQSEAEDIYE